MNSLHLSENEIYPEKASHLVRFSVKGGKLAVLTWMPSIMRDRHVKFQVP